MISYLNWVDMKHGVEERSADNQRLFTQKIFELEDQNKDGTISMAEFIDDVEDDHFIAKLYRKAGENYLRMKENAKIRDQIYKDWKDHKN